MRKRALATWTALALMLVLSGQVPAQKKGEPVAPVSVDKDGLAISGYDPVAYFAAGKPMKGLERFSHTWNGATWRFASAENRDTFAKNPEKYAPQFGGYCAWAVSEGYTAPSDPQAWKVVEGKLYLNYNAKVQGMWQPDAKARIAKGEANWPKLHK